jgi:hypothetical protein
LAESKNHFKIRNGDIEIEYEGPLTEVNKRFDETYKWVTSQKTKTPKKKEKETDEAQEENKKDKRGGPRKGIYPQWVQKFKKDGFFKQKKSLDEVIKKFEDSGIPSRNKRTAIRNALINDTHKKDSKLTSTKDGEAWYFWEN